MANEIDLDRLVDDWSEKQDPFRAVANATKYLRDAPGQLDFPAALPILEHVAEPAWDGPGADPRLVLDVFLAAEPSFLRAEATLGINSLQRLTLRTRSQLLIARAWYHAGYPRQAFATTLAILTYLRNFVEGRVALRQALSSAFPNAVAAAAVGALGLYPATLRRADYRPETERRFMRDGLDLVMAYLRMDRDCLPVLYDRSSAVGSQWFYAVVRQHPDDKLVRALYELDVATRPRDARGQATTALRDFEFARRFGDIEAENRCRAEAIPNLRLFPLERHERAVERHGYLAA